MIMKNVMNRLLRKVEMVRVPQHQSLDMNGCPNCWGHQEYQGMQYDQQYQQSRVRKFLNPLGKTSFVQKFVETHITGTRRKRHGGKLFCPTC